jgi:hypothetical protein
VRAWAILLGGLIVWAVHFFALYAIGSLLPGTGLAVWLSLGVSVPAILANALIIRISVRRAVAPDPLGRWIFQVGAIGAGMSLLAVVWQSFPGLLV